MSAFQVPKCQVGMDSGTKSKAGTLPRSHWPWYNKNLWAKGKTYKNKSLGRFHEVMPQPTNTGDTQDVI